MQFLILYFVGLFEVGFVSAPYVLWFLFILDVVGGIWNMSASVSDHCHFTFIAQPAESRPTKKVDFRSVPYNRRNQLAKFAHNTWTR